MAYLDSPPTRAASTSVVDHVDVRFGSVLFRSPEEAAAGVLSTQPDCFHDLNLDQIVASITAGWKDYQLEGFFHAHLTDLDAVAYRQEVMRDLELGGYIVVDNDLITITGA